MTPLIFVSNTNELYEFPKMFFVYFLGVVIVSSFLIYRVFRPKPLKFPSIFVLLVLFSTVLSTIFSEHLYTSVWGYYTRFNGGLVSVLVFFGIYFSAVNLFSKEDLCKLLKFSLLPIIPISIYGISQHYGFQFLWGESPVGRAFSTFGQPNWLAQYIGMLLLVCLFLVVSEGRSIFWSAVYLLGFGCLWFTYSVSGLVGCVTGFCVFMVLFFRSKKFDKGTLRVVLLLVFVSVLIAVFNLGLFKDRLHDVFYDMRKLFSRTETYALEETTTPQDYKISDPGFIRFGLWKGTWQLITSSPKVFFLGTGPETYPYAFQPFRPRQLNYSSEWDFVFNKPHNYYLQIWSEFGLFGLAVGLLIISWTLRKAASFLLPGFVAFYVSNFFGWPVVATSLLFWLWLAYLEVSHD